MTPRTRWTAVAFAALSLACSDIASPARDDFYDWRLVEPSPSGSGVDTISFHWPADRLPVRIWVEQTDPLPADVARAITIWRDGFLYGEYDATVVGDSTTADVVVRSGPPPGPQLSTARLGSALAPQCAGATDVELSDDHTQLLLPIRIYINPLLVAGAAGLEECLALTVVHELGHSLGIFRHSPNPADLMYLNPTVQLPSERDRTTAEILYHLPSTVAAVGP
jgi:predicted Zn-dependent protease